MDLCSSACMYVHSDLLLTVGCFEYHKGARLPKSLWDNCIACLMRFRICTVPKEIPCMYGSQRDSVCMYSSQRDSVYVQFPKRFRVCAVPKEIPQNGSTCLPTQIASSLSQRRHCTSPTWILVTDPESRYSGVSSRMWYMEWLFFQLSSVFFRMDMLVPLGSWSKYQKLKGTYVTTRTYCHCTTQYTIKSCNWSNTLQIKMLKWKTGEYRYSSLIFTVVTVNK